MCLRLRRNRKILTIVFLSSLLFIFFCQAQDEKLNPILEQGIGQYKHENFEEALGLLKKAREEDPASTLAAYYLGLNYKKLQDYQLSIPNLRDAVTYSPKIKGALIELIDSLYQVGEYAEAQRWIVEAEKEGIRPAQTAFLKGLVLLKLEDASGAIASFEKAKELDNSMEQAANYQIGVTHLKARDFRYAREAFKAVVGLNPSSSMAEYANEYIDAIVKKEKALRPWKFSFGSCWQYDDNVVLKPSDQSLAANITGQEDSRQVYTGQIEYNHYFKDDFSLKGQYYFYYAKQNDLGFYDTISNTLVVQPSWNFEKSLLAFPLSYNHTIINDTSYLSNPSASAIYNFMIADSNMGQVYLAYSNKDYLWSPSMPDEDRDSNEASSGLGWYFFFAKKKGFFNLRYGFNREWTEGNNWEYFGNKINAALLIPLFEKLNLTISGGTFFQRFLSSHSIFNVYRRDNVYTASSLIAYKFLEDSEIQVQYTYVRDSSNISIYDYDRNIYSIGVQLKF
ncbi:MAG: tetratricopeptide repeat protein [Candidatus Omnitrophica bacterium]|nr:tetratricopeptide repeat protein [Candidatus Omnitrophota bacterium]